MQIKLFLELFNNLLTDPDHLFAGGAYLLSHPSDIRGSQCVFEGR